MNRATARNLKGWAVIWMFVAAYDAWAGVAAEPTLSKVYRDSAHQHPLVCATGSIYVMAHLWGLIPRKADPLCRYSDAWAARRESNPRPTV